MKFFLISCCGVTMTAGTTRASSSPSMSPSGQKIVSPAHRRRVSSPSRGGMSSPAPRRGRQASSSPRGRGAKSQSGFSNPRVIPVRQTRSELGIAPMPQRTPRRKNGRLVGSATSALQYSEWTPSLCTIAEDNVVAVKRTVRDRTPSIERAVSEKSGREMSRVRSRSYTDDNGQTSVAVIPAYAPTPFLF